MAGGRHRLDTPVPTGPLRHEYGPPVSSSPRLGRGDRLRPSIPLGDRLSAVCHSQEPPVTHPPAGRSVKSSATTSSSRLARRSRPAALDSVTSPVPPSRSSLEDLPTVDPHRAYYAHREGQARPRPRPSRFRRQLRRRAAGARDRPHSTEFFGGTHVTAPRPYRAVKVVSEGSLARTCAASKP